MPRKRTPPVDGGMLPMLPEVPEFHVLPSHPVFDDVPAPAGFWGILARSALHMGETIDVTTARAVREGLLEFRPCEGSC